MYSYTQKILNFVEFQTNEIDEAQLSHDIHHAICELSYSLKGICYSAYGSACSIQADDKNWQETKTLEQLQAVCIISELLDFMIHTITVELL